MSTAQLWQKTPKTKEFLAKIGEIIVLLNHLESMVEFFTWELIGSKGNAHDVQNMGRRITLPLDYKGKIDLARSLVIERYGVEKEKKIFKSVYTKLQNCGEFRNDIAHSLWFIEYGTSKEDLATHKLNWTKAYKKGKAFDFSNAYKDVSLEDLTEISKTLSSTITLVTQTFMTLLNSKLLF